LGFDWDDDDPIDFIAQQVLPTREFHDFEQIYLDAQEQVSEQAGKGQNRWFFLNMAIWDMLKASDPKQQHRRALALADLLSPHFNELFLSNGKSELWRIVNDLQDNESQAAFSESVRKAVRENDLVKTAGLFLSLELEHLKECAAFWGLTEKEIRESQLQDLLEMLPLRLAIGLLFLYSTSQKNKDIPNYNQVKLPDDLFAGLIAAGFISFYQQVDEYRPQNGVQKSSDA